MMETRLQPSQKSSGGHAPDTVALVEGGVDPGLLEGRHGTPVHLEVSIWR